MTTRPNILVIMSDQQRWDTLGSAGNPAAQTPHLDALAERGTVFDGCYTPFPLCCPSRASLWTGRMPRHHHVLGNWRALRPELREHGVAAAFRDAGYHTTYTGKWHVPATTPQRMGFADTAAIPAIVAGRDRGRYIEPYRAYAREQGYELLPDDMQNLTPNEQAALRDPSSRHRTTSEIPLEHCLETWQTEQFLGTLDRRPDDRPWFAVCSYNAPHSPMVVPHPYEGMIDRDLVELPESFGTGPATRPREVRESAFATAHADLDRDGWTDVVAHYQGFCSLVDTQVGNILDYLERGGQLDRTIVVYTTDHGDMMGAHRLMAKGHLLHYEEALRIPMLVSHPDAGAARTPNLVSMVDVASTLAELAGVTWDGGDGVSFAAMVGDSAAAPTRSYVTAETVLYDGSPEGNGEYTPPSNWDAHRDSLNLSVRTPGFRYVFRSRDVDELYDHTSDPGEQDNLATREAYGPERARLRRLLADEVADVFPGAVPALAGG